MLTLTETVPARIDAELPASAEIAHAGLVLMTACFEAARAAGWHSDLHTGEPFDLEKQRALFPTRAALIHSEISEALEGHRKGLMDDKLPDRLMVEVELADAVIRIMDCAGAMQLDIAGAIAEKLHYNAVRADHKLESRRSAGGKAY